jgi:hypothetical protein
VFYERAGEPSGDCPLEFRVVLRDAQKWDADPRVQPGCTIESSPRGLSVLRLGTPRGCGFLHGSGVDFHPRTTQKYRPRWPRGPLGEWQLRVDLLVICHSSLASNIDSLPFSLCFLQRRCTHFLPFKRGAANAARARIRNAEGATSLLVREQPSHESRPRDTGLDCRGEGWPGQ